MNVPENVVNVPSFCGELKLDSHFLTDIGVGATKRVLCVLATRHVQVDYCPVLCDLGEWREAWQPKAGETHSLGVPILVSIVGEENAIHIASWMIRVSLQEDHFFFGCSLKHSAAQTVIFDRLVQKKLSSLHQVMTKFQVSVEELASRWFQRLFVDCLPYDAVLRVCDAFLAEGGSWRGSIRVY